MNSLDIDQLINESLNKDNTNIINKNNIDYDLLIFSDGAFERVKKRSSFGIYVFNENKDSEFYKYNNSKIIKKIDKDLIFYNNNTFDIVYYNYIDNNNCNIKCIHDSCNFYAIYNNKNETIGKYCKVHKNDDMSLIVNYFAYDATNIRAEGLGILYSLIYIKLIALNKLVDKNEILSKLNLKKINNIHDSLKVINKLNINEYKNKFLIVTDSEFWINVITKWSNNWIKKKLYMEKKNLDIIIYINYYLSLLNNNKILINFQFVRGHADKKNNNNTLDIFQKGNIMADKLANIGKENTDLSVKLI
jgi:ribonuclease HI